jgi:hypothetical protein
MPLQASRTLLRSATHRLKTAIHQIAASARTAKTIHSDLKGMDLF